MASLYQRQNRWIIDVYGFGRVRVGTSKSEASNAHRFIQKLEEAKKYGFEIDAATQFWLGEASQKLINRLQAIGLLNDFNVWTIGDLIKESNRYSESNKPQSKQNEKQNQDSLIRCFGSDYLLRDFAEADAVHYKSWLLRQGKHSGGGLAPATVARRITRCRSMFRLAVDKQWISKNPFANVKSGSQTNSTRSHFVTVDVARKVIEQLPSAELRLAFALGRFGGLRIPSEIIHLEWSGINFDIGSMTFRSIKTEHHEGKEQRTCPIFVELRPYLDDVWDQSGDSEYVLPSVKAWNNPRQMLEKSVRAALQRLGMKPWQKLFTNLRATRATEVADQFGIKAESEWIGHGADIAMKHYFMVTEQKWLEATGKTQNANLKSGSTKPA